MNKVFIVAVLCLLVVTLAPAWAGGPSGLEAAWYGAVETVSTERVVIKNEEGRFSVSKKLIEEVQGVAGLKAARAGEYFELRLPLHHYLAKVEKSRDIYLVKELGRMPASVAPVVEESPAKKK